MGLLDGLTFGSGNTTPPDFTINDNWGGPSPDDVLYGGNMGSGNTGRIPQVISTSGGSTAYPDKLSATLNAILSGLAITFGRDAVPTTVSPTQYSSNGRSGTMSPEMLAYLQAQQLSGGNNTGANVQRFIQQNSGALLIGGVILVAFMMKPPTRR